MTGATLPVEGAEVTGTRDRDYNLIWFASACLSNAMKLEGFIQDAERDQDEELIDFFQRAQADSRKGAEQAKAILRDRLAA